MPPLPPHSRPTTSKRHATVGIDFGKVVYVPHDVDGYQQGRLVDIKTDALAVELSASREVVEIGHDEVFPAEESRVDVDDNCALMYLNEATLLHNCRVRYKRKQIYTYVANILISINPYEQVPGLYSPTTIKSYMGKSLGTMPPHVFAIADMAYRDMKRLKQSQSVIVSGESGAGKTESQKSILRYLCDCWGDAAGGIEKRLLETNPILEAFGNAKTLRNNNSSRFGKFVEIHFTSKFTVAGGFVSHYLLEKSRLCHQNPGERNYHIFYEILAGLDDARMNEWKLTTPDKFRYLSGGCTQFFASPDSKSKIPAARFGPRREILTDDLIDDYSDFHRLQKSLGDCGLTADTLNSVFRIIAGILHLGNVLFEDSVDDSRGGCRITDASTRALANAATLLGLEPAELGAGLVTRVMQPAKGGVMGTMIRVPLKDREAANARDALAKAIYSRLFDDIVATINNSIPFTDAVNYIGVLDIAGFEFFAVNSFEQFCINYCNEKLQQFFNDRILKHEQDLYEWEGIKVARIEYSDNLDCIELFENKASGLLDLLDEEARLPKPSPQHYTDSVHRANKDHFRLSSPRKSRIREHRDMREDEGFLIRHYAGTVCYQTSQFLDKNNDALHMSLLVLIEHSSNPLLGRLFHATTSDNASSVPNRPGRSSAGKLAFTSVSGKFRSQLGRLLEKLKVTGTHFVRCIKPNSTMKPQQFDGSQILGQLKCAGMPSVLKLMQKGFPSRTSFADLYDMYKELLPPKLKRLDPRLFVKCLFHALGLNDVDFKFGMTKVFFRPGKFAEFDQLMHQDKSHMAALIGKVQAWLHRTRWKKAQYGAWSVIKLQRKIEYRRAALITIQSAIRGYSTRKQQAPRLSAYRRVVALQKRFGELTPLGHKLSDESKALWVKRVMSFSEATNKLLATVKAGGPGFDRTSVLSTCEKLDAELGTLLVEIKRQVEKDSREKARQVEAKVASEKARQSAEAAEAEEQQRKLRELRELQVKRQAEEAARQTKIVQLEATLKTEREEEAKRAEQERLDAELARRLAADDGQNLMPLMGAAKNNNNHIVVANGSKAVDLSMWNYAQLRDTINTSNNIEMLFACRSELERRLKLYHQWKANNQPSTPATGVMRAPPIIASPTAAPVPHPELIGAHGAPPPIQRYFRVPFTPPSGPAGMWYAHFDGQFVFRQMELHPNKPPILLIAGRDDAMMCELTLDQTQLTRKKGAEILATEFDSIWNKYCLPPRTK